MCQEEEVNRCYYGSTPNGAMRLCFNSKAMSLTIDETAIYRRIAPFVRLEIVFKRSCTLTKRSVKDRRILSTRDNEEP